jgi:DNA polymerase III subunit delta
VAVNQADLQGMLKDRDFPPLILLHGEEGFLRDGALEQIRDLTVPQDCRDFNLNVYHGKDAKVQELLDTARTYPIFASRRLIILKDVDSLAAPDLEALLPYLKDPVPETILLCTTDKLDGRRKFFQDFKKYGAVFEFKKIYDNQLPAFVREQAKRSGRSFTEEGLALFCRRTGVNLREVHGELVKLFAYAGEKTLVDVAEVRAVVVDSRIDSIFDLTDAIGGGKTEQALGLLQRLLAEGGVPLVLLTMITRHYRQLWKIRELLDRGEPNREIGGRLRINPYFLDGLIRQSRSLPADRYRPAFEKFLLTDQALKSSGAHPAALLEQLVLELAGGVRRP